MFGNPGTPETVWLDGLRAGSEAALRHIFDQYYPWLLSEAWRIVPDESTCEDLVQEVFVELWRKRSELDIHTSLGAYLRRATVNRALNFLKSQKRYQFSPSDDIFEKSIGHVPAPDDTTEAEKDDLETALHAAIESLPEKCRLVFRLSRFEELSHKEISERLDISTKTIENQITKALRTLRAALTNRPELSSVGIFVVDWLLGHRG